MPKFSEATKNAACGPRPEDISLAQPREITTCTRKKKS